ncbi:hypothetical protein NVP1188A_01 [Vibrio phage 1.188.A._10N.286.51.A6]|uniref:TMhelix containing protein n=3 Tax=Mukerjeevirus mv51A6 TaxID=2734162 RepID=A0A2I7RIT9_9CAUD|nr:hypothetical protein HOU77_gp01 [Vibrio phage 1.188.A._10N.286.51.A6]AUR93569.1 hypothetical protein NVP1188A_01 [Vibrio phage 1.188.A._10N.286.51.A6]AUR93655.1 hypothetical protein NVP1188B_01 [Vibrio phage 1.188.B._10N.286.51.A6]AUR93741.1 hypothetical protein NVP1188C_01 [Vibrio phage 1.188.C._10N.286.51.A6]
MSSIKETLGTTITTALGTINESVPLAGVTITTGLVAVNSWLVEMVNEDADFEKVNELKAKMLATPKKS